MIKSIGLLPPPLTLPVNKKWILSAIFSVIILVGLIYLFTKKKDTPITDLTVEASKDSVIKKDIATTPKLRPEIRTNAHVSPIANNENEPNDLPSITGVGHNNFYFVRKTINDNIEYSSGQLGGCGSP